jgi:hypothetical protein
MKKLSAAFFAAFLLIVIAAPAAQASTDVRVRIEGKTETLFEGTVPVDVHKIKPSSVAMPEDCDGAASNGGVPGATATLAAAEAMESIGETFDGRGAAEFITRWGPDEEEPFGEFGGFWGVLTNDVFANVGGCQLQVQENDEVLWVWDAFSERPRLALYPAAANYVEGLKPTTAIVQPGEPLPVEVVAFPDDFEKPIPDHPSRAGSVPYEGAEVAPVATNAKGFQRIETSSPATVKTDADGKASIVFPTPGIYRIKATEGAPGAETAVRSNELTVCVQGETPVRRIDGCEETIFETTLPDRVPPRGVAPAPAPAPAATPAPPARAQISHPALDRSKLDQGKLTVNWKILTAGPGIARWKVSSKTLGDKGAKFVVRAHGSRKTSATVHLPLGASYKLRLTVTDAGGATSTFALGKVSVPGATKR